MVQKVEIITGDGIKLVGNHYKFKKGSPGISLFHMMPAAKESFDNFARKLNEAGMGVVAIDLRGHGKSQDGPEGYKSFKDEEHQRSIDDIRAAVDFQRKEVHNPLLCLIVRRH